MISDCKEGGRLPTRFEPTWGKQKIGWTRPYHGVRDRWCFPDDSYSPSVHRDTLSIVEAASKRSPLVNLHGWEFFTWPRLIETVGFLEAHNLAVAEAYYAEDLGDMNGYRRKVAEFGFEDPKVEIVEEERKNWQLVKKAIVFPAQEHLYQEGRWFVLTLVNKEDGRIMGEWKGTGIVAK
jgi:hypothetical protein